MIYKLDLNIKPNPMIPWNYVFMCLSIEQFRLVYDKLDFPFDPPENVRQLAHDFSFTREFILYRSEEHKDSLETLVQAGETVSINLLEGTSPDNPYIKRRDALFTNTFSHLERMGYAEAVYEWGKQTEDYYKFTDRQRYTEFDALASWCNLLRRWTVLEWLKQPLLPEQVPFGVYSTEWENVIAEWKPIVTRVPPERFKRLVLQPLPLSAASRLALQAIVLHHEMRRLQLKMAIDQIEISPKTAWEDFALRAGTALITFRLEG